MRDRGSNVSGFRVSVKTEIWKNPSLPRSERAAWRGVYKKGLQNLERVRVRGQNLDNK